MKKILVLLVSLLFSLSAFSQGGTTITISRGGGTDGGGGISPNDSLFHIQNIGWVYPYDTILTTEETGFYQNTLTVAKDYGEYTSINDAVDSVITAGSDTLNRWVILVYPGVYSEPNNITLPEGVCLAATCAGSVVVTPQSTGDLFRMSNFTKISGMQISNVTAGSAIDIDSSGVMLIEDCIFNSVDTAVTINNSLAEVEMVKSYFSNGGTLAKKISKGINQYGGNSTITNCRVIEQDSVQVPFYFKGSTTFSTIFDAVSFSANVDTFLYAHDTARVVVNTNSIVAAKNGLKSFTGANVQFNGGSHFRITEQYTEKDDASMLGGYANNDDNDVALVIEGKELHVGDASEGYEVCLGEGDSYSDDILVYEYNGSTYTDVSDSAKNIDGFSVDFPNTSINTAIYISSNIDSNITFHGVKLTMVDSMTIGAGAIAQEYWNGTSWEEFNGMVTDASSPFVPRAKTYFEQTQGTHIRYNIEMTNDDWTPNDDPGFGVNRKWVRYRITTPITTTPRIDQIKLHTNRWEANSDGFTELFGNARNSQLLPLNIGSGEPFEGNMQNQTNYVDEDIGVGFQTNRFTATGDKLGFPVNFPDNLDTSSPLKIVWSGHYATGGTNQWTIRWKIVSPGDNLFTSEPAATGESFSTVISITTTAGINELFTATLDVSDAIPTRRGGFGDQLWFSIQPTTLTGNFSITNIGAAYWTWAEGGHF